MDGHIHPDTLKKGKNFFQPQLNVRIGKYSFDSFHFFGVLGFILGSILGAVVCYYTGLQVPVILLMSLTGAATFFLLAFGAKIITGKEVIVYYHHEIAILVFCSVILILAGWPVLPYLDITLLGIATFLAFGRIGCFSVGCCHGKPAHKGVVYGGAHVKKGFTWYYEGTPLLPVQLIESAFVFILIISGTILLLLQFPPGLFLTLYTVVYGAFRFVIEFFRGDPNRPYFRRLSEAQWTTLILIAVSVMASLTGLIPFYMWHMIIAGSVFAGALVLVITSDAKQKLTKPGHIGQIAFALKKLDNNDEGQPAVRVTKLGLNLSKGCMSKNGRMLTHYTISGNKEDALNQTTVYKLASVIKQLEHHKGGFEILQKKNGIFHIVFSA